jgi:hypothetical protein
VLWIDKMRGVLVIVLNAPFVLVDVLRKRIKVAPTSAGTPLRERGFKNADDDDLLTDLMHL